MANTATKERIVVHPGSEEMHWFFVPADRLDDAKRALDAVGIRHWVGHARVSAEDGSPLAMVRLYPGREVKDVQRALDGME